ncbi:retrovirus-related Pol polyprotein from transposon 412 [Trichonephila clavipes]|nr:retrovirus-related Pol polyprotein from transposon 412 [Trichonephila clavipes]
MLAPPLYVYRAPGGRAPQFEKHCTRGRLQLYNEGAPFKRIVFDILGPLPRSSDGNNILVDMDYFTKWPEAYSIPYQEASTVAEVLVQHCISRFGAPLQLHSNQGRNVDSAVCKRLCEILAIDKTKTTALHPQSDGMVERFNRTILNSLSLLVSSNQQDWDKKLPFFLLAYRSAVHETTGYSLSQMLFGRDLRLPADLLFSQPTDAPLAPEEYIEKLQERMEEMHHLASGKNRHGFREDEDPIRRQSNRTRLPLRRQIVVIESKTSQMTLSKAADKLGNSLHSPKKTE